MNVEVQLRQASQPVTYRNVINAYTKSEMFCVLFEKDGIELIHKYPLCSVFRVIEEREGSKR